MSFKLLAIRPLKDCNPKFLKNLEENQVYQFYNDYKFHFKDNDKDKEVIEIEKLEQSVPENLFDQGKTKINISAIVGKNGSGKSALVELLYVTYYNIAVSEKIINKKQINISLKRKIKLEFKKLITNYADNNQDNISNNKIFLFIEECLDDFLKHNLDEILSYEKQPKNYLKFKSKLLNYIEVLRIVLNVYLINYKDLSIFDNDINNGFIDKKNIDKFFLSTVYKDRVLISFNCEIEKKVNSFIDILNDFIYNLNFIENDIHVEIFFEINGKIIKISKTQNSFNHNFEFCDFEKNKLLKFNDLNFILDNVKFSDLFYNLVINYSLYGLNSNETGKWIEKLFHKNDGYQTPIVINPFRHEGNININSENELVRDRLLTNLIINDKLKQISKNSRVDSLLIRFKKNEDYKKFVFDELFLNEEYKKIKKQIILFYNYKKHNSEKIKSIDFKLNNLDHYCLNYIFKKLKRIANNYIIYSKYRIDEKDTNFSSKNIDKILGLLNELSKDKSHISYKIRQTINFILLNKFINNSENLIYNQFKNENFSNEVIEYSFEKYSEYIKSHDSISDFDVINFLPPSIFEIDFKFDNKSTFSMLSSGEKQQVFSTNSILYHLINLNSTKENRFPLKYPNINLILDEIELYAHPEMQRTYLKELLNGINKLELNFIKSINILFITHSPFILSDIPKQNVLFLEDGIPQDFKKMNTFGANITDLLADSFFIEDGLIGDFAKVKIEETIKWVNLEKHKKDSKSQQPYKLDETEYNYHKKVIELIDEKVVKMKLAEMMDELKGGDDFEKELAFKEFEYLKSKFNF